MFDEQCLHSIDRNELLKIRRSIGTVAATSNLISNLKVWENITLPLLYHTGSLAPEAADQAMQLLNETGLVEQIWVLPGYLSAAERIMITFIRAAISSPRLLIVAACLDDLPGLQRKTFLQMAARLQSKNDAPAALFITTEPMQLPGLLPDITIDLRQNPARITRNK
jgi:ABC-type ATPase involved in cell division